MSNKIIIFTCLILILAIGCSKDKKESSEELEEYSMSGSLEGQLLSRNVNYDSLSIAIAEITKSISLDPSCIECKKKLVDTCYDTLNQIIFVTGTGKPLKNARTASIAINYAEKAATIEAYRWAYYIKKWRMDPQYPKMQQLSTQIPGSQIITKNMLSDSTMQVLIAINAGNIR
jgi:hypothetical protein